MDRSLLLSCVDEGMSTKQIASKFNKGQTTVRYWLKKYDLKTTHKSFSNGYNNAKKVNKDNQYCYKCRIKLSPENAYGRTSREIYCSLCKQCHKEDTLSRRIEFKKKCVDYKGGSCLKCGYNKDLTALEFHHIDSSKKSPTYRKRFRYWGFERQKKELENCIIVCSNCHREIHSGDVWKT